MPMPVEAPSYEIAIESLGAGWPALPAEAGAGLSRLLATVLPPPSAHARLRLQIWLSDRWQAEIEVGAERKAEEAAFAQGHHLLYRVAEFAARQMGAELPGVAAGRFEDMRTDSPAAMAFLWAGWGTEGRTRIERWRRGFELDPTCVALRTGLAQELAEQGQLETAASLVSEAHIQDGTAAAALGLAIWAGLGEDFWALAERLLQQAVQTDGQNALAAAALAALLARRSGASQGHPAGAGPGLNDRLDEALLLATQATQLAPDDYRCWSALADVHRAGGDFRQAGFYYGFALRLDPEAASVLKDAAANWLLAGEPGQALPLIERALVAAPEDAENYGNLALALHAQGEVEAARTAAERAHGLRPGDARFVQLLAVIEEKAGETQP